MRIRFKFRQVGYEVGIFGLMFQKARFLNDECFGRFFVCLLDKIEIVYSSKISHHLSPSDKSFTARLRIDSTIWEQRIKKIIDHMFLNMARAKANTLFKALIYACKQTFPYETMSMIRMQRQLRRSPNEPKSVIHQFITDLINGTIKIENIIKRLPLNVFFLHKDLLCKSSHTVHSERLATHLDLHNRSQNSVTIATLFD